MMLMKESPEFIGELGLVLYESDVWEKKPSGRNGVKILMMVMYKRYGMICGILRELF